MQHVRVDLIFEDEEIASRVFEVVNGYDKARNENVIKTTVDGDVPFEEYKALSSDIKLKVRYASDQYGCVLGFVIYNNGELVYEADDEHIVYEFARMMHNDNYVGE